MRRLWIIIFTAVFFLGAPAFAADQPDGDAAWAEIVHGPKLPQRPPEWKQKAPTPEELAAFTNKVGVAAAELADHLKAFYKKYPNHPKAADAWIKEQDLRKLASGPSKAPAASQKPLTANPQPPPPRPKPAPAAQPQPVKSAARPTGPTASKPSVGKPLNLAFTSTDGRQVNLSQMAGKVVLVDFWATWCPPCVGEVPHIRKAYKQYRDQGFEIVGVSFDLESRELLDFVSKNDMTWPQYFDGGGWTNAVNNIFQIREIPTMYLVDKKGVLRDTDAREDLANKVRALLAEAN